MRYLITGGTGSLGQAMAGFLLGKDDVDQVRILSRNELRQAQMRSGFSDNSKLRFFIGDVRDKARLVRAFRGADIVIHAAAMKRIEVCEYDPEEAVKTNIIGSENVINASIEARVKTCVLISSDKAVDPVNTYGATKMTAERLFIQAAYSHGDPRTTFCVVRYGNVSGSNGSVLPAFRKQKDSGGMITLTHEDMTRFIITLDQAVKLVYAGVHEAQPGEVWTRSLPKVRIKSLAGFVLEEGEESGSKIVVTKPGPYEKIHECLVSQNEIRRARVKYSKFFDGVVIVIHPAWLDKQPAGVGFSKPYTSDEAEEMTQEDIRKMFQESKGEAV